MDRAKEIMAIADKLTEMSAEFKHQEKAEVMSVVSAILLEQAFSRFMRSLADLTNREMEKDGIDVEKLIKQAKEKKLSPEDILNGKGDQIVREAQDNKKATLN